MEQVDVAIVGAGPAGLSAALLLGRCRRRVVVCDGGEPRNAASQALHGFLTRDGIPPAELRRLGRAELAAYPSVQVRDIGVRDVLKQGGRFEVMLDDGGQLDARKVLLATGVIDDLPAVPGLADLYGRSVFHCPYCDGWEVREQPLAVYGRGETGCGLALELTVWSSDIVLCSDGPAELPPDGRDRLARCRIAVREERIARLEGQAGQLERIVFAGGASLSRRALFFSSGQRQRSDLPARLGCTFTADGCVATGHQESTNVPGLYVAGDASRAVQFAIVAAAEGAEAAYAINTALLREDLAYGKLS